MKAHGTVKSILVVGSMGLLLFGTACTKSQRSQKVLQNKGSDTMVNLAQAWAEAFRTKNREVAVAVTGGGSGTGIAALMNGTVDIANSSRAIKPDEMKKAKENTGKEVVGSIVALDALAVFVHKDNPIDKLSIEDLACIYGEGGNCTGWQQVRSTTVPGCPNNEIVRISRQSNSGTYQYFREAVMGDKRDFKLGSRDMNGSKDVVDLVEKTPCAIGYSGMGYMSPNVKSVCISKTRDGACFAPSVTTVLNKTYPIARELYMYTLGIPTGEVKAYLDWIKGSDAQKIVTDLGYVPFPDEKPSAAR